MLEKTLARLRQKARKKTAFLSYRTIYQAINVTKDTAYRVLCRLKEQLFLLASLNDEGNEVIYTTSLPENGVALLKEVIKDKEEEEEEV